MGEHEVIICTENQSITLKGLDIHLFKEQLEYLKKHYNFVTIKQIIAAFDGKMDGENMLTGGACPLILFC